MIIFITILAILYLPAVLYPISLCPPLRQIIDRQLAKPGL